MNLPISIGILILATLAAITLRFARHRPDDTGRRIGSDLLAGGILFAFFAPGIGGIAVTLVVSAIALDPKNLMMVIFGLPWFYVFGAVPALLCGVVAGAWRPDRPTWGAYGKVAIVGGLFGIAFVQAFAGKNVELQNLLFALCVGGLPGVFSAFLCAYWYYGKPGSERAGKTAAYQSSSP